MLSSVYRYGYQVLKAVWFFTRPSIEGSTCTVIHDGSVLLVRQTYADRDAWQLPGGGIHPKEDPEHALRRELKEEVALEVARVIKTGEYKVIDDYRTVHLHCFAAVAKSTAVTPDHREIRDARWFKADRLPRPLRWGTEELVIKAITALS